MSTKSTRSAHRVSMAGQNDVRKGDHSHASSFDTGRLLGALARLVEKLSVGGKVAAYEQVAEQLSALAGRAEPWSWRYVASVNSRAISPSSKFLRVLDLHLQEISPRKKQWFYFVRRYSVAAVFDKSIHAEMITAQMQSLGFKAVTFSRYMQVKGVATRR